MNIALQDKPVASTAGLPARLHHNAWVVVDQERTRAFYEDVLEMPLVQFWIEEGIWEGKPFVLSHALYALEDGSALSFFSMSDQEQYEKFKAGATTPFTHVALKVDQAAQDRILDRLVKSAYETFTVEHGYCRSIYVTDPDGLRLEFTIDSPELNEIKAFHARTAHDTLQRWMLGDRQSNNAWRQH